VSDPRRLRTDTRGRHDGRQGRRDFANARRFTPKEIAMLNGDATKALERRIVTTEDKPTPSWVEMSEEVRRLAWMRIQRLTQRFDAGTDTDDDELSLSRMGVLVKGMLVEEGKNGGGDPSTLSDEKLAKIAKG
jgi:hypothetical protein